MRHEPLYRDAVRYSWKFAWHHKVLWILGLFSAALGQLGLFDIFAHTYSATQDTLIQPTWFSSLHWVRNVFLSVGENFSLDMWISVGWLGVILFGFFLMFPFVAVVSQGAIIHTMAQATRHKNVNIDRAWVAGVRHFWRLFFLNAFQKIVQFGLGLFIGWVAFDLLLHPTVLNTLTFIIFFPCMIFIGLLMTFIMIYAAGYVVVEEYPLLMAIREAWRLFCEHWLVSIEVGIILLFFQVLVGLLAFAGVIFFIFPIFLLWNLAIITVNPFLFLVGVVVGLLAFAAFLLLLAGVFSIFTTSTWTYLFMHMHHRGVPSRILSWLRPV